MTSTFCPSGFSKPTWSTPASLQVDSNLFAPRRTVREKWANAQYWPLRVISLVCEWIVTIPPHGNGPMFGFPFSSSARFHPLIAWHQCRIACVKVCPQFVQSVA